MHSHDQDFIYTLLKLYVELIHLKDFVAILQRGAYASKVHVWISSQIRLLEQILSFKSSLIWEGKQIFFWAGRSLFHLYPVPFM